MKDVRGMAHANHNTQYSFKNGKYFQNILNKVIFTLHLWVKKLDV